MNSEFVLTQNTDSWPGVGREVYVTASLLRPYIKYAARLGVDYQGILSEHGVTLDALNQSGARIPVLLKRTILKQLIDLSGDPLFGLGASRYTSPDSYSINGFISMNCANLRECLIRTLPLHRILSDNRVMHLREGHDRATVYWQLDSNIDYVRRNNTEALVGTWVEYSRSVLGLNEEPLYISFSHEPAGGKDYLSSYQDILKCDVRFEQDFNGVVYQKKSLEEKIPDADSRLLEILTRHAKGLLQEISDTAPFTLQVKEIMRTLLRLSTPSRDKVADHFGIASRTLQRKLLEEGISFSETLNEVRMEMTVYLMRDQSLSIEDIAEQLGFKESRSFHRSFKRWTGKTVGAYRRELLATN